MAVAFDDIDKVIDRHIIAEENVSVEDLCSRSRCQNSVMYVWLSMRFGSVCEELEIVL